MCQPACRVSERVKLFICFFELDCTVESVLQGRRTCIRSEQLLSSAGDISNEAHSFVTHYSVCPPHVSPTSGPPGVPQHTWLWSSCLTSRLFLLAALTETEPDESKAGEGE